MIWAIGDTHFDHTKDKSMDIFGANWKDHDEKIIDFWKKNVKDDDLVLLVGDISWALKLEEAFVDLKMIDDLPGIKCIIKGNHDYWWSTKNKLEGLGLKSIHFLHNDSFTYKDYVISGSRGWMAKDSEDFSEEDEKIFNRELGRLDLSLKDSKDQGAKKRICLIHYPPFDSKKEPNEFLHLMNKYDVSLCLYGHLHGPGHVMVKEGKFLGIDVKCVSSDYVDFKLQKIG